MLVQGGRAAISLWSDLGDFAPHTKGVWEAVAELYPSSTLADYPECLGLPPIDPESAEWMAVLGQPSQRDRQVTNREVLLRYALSRAIVDQGTDFLGVEMWHRLLIERCYAAGIPILHAPLTLVDRYSDVLDIADGARVEVTAARADVWAAASPNRKAGSYTPFNVDGLRGGTQAHWFLSARFFPALLLAHAAPGGLTEVLFGGLQGESLLEASRRIRNDTRIGLGHCIGDKATDLFVKWAVGTLRLQPAGHRWTPMDVPIPMDQRIGRVMMRSGFMDEFFNTAELMRSYGAMWADETGWGLPADDAALPEAPYFLKVMEFRRNARATRRPEAAAWLASAWAAIRDGRPPVWPPQTVVTMLCEAAARDGIEVTPVTLDDAFMAIAENRCTDRDPMCNECPLSEVCQAHTDPDRSMLKLYFT